MKLASFRSLSEEQDVIYNLPLTENYLVSGPPGTGKTLIALHRASMYQKNQKDPVILSYSRLLSNYTSEAAGNLQIPGTIQTYHKWVPDTYRACMRKEAPRISEWVFDWPRITTDLFTVMLEQKPYLLIDEGQDLPAEFYSAASLLAGNVTVFADENQRITEIQSTIDDIRRCAGIKKANEYRLTKNYRNTREIAQVAACYYAGLRGGKPDLPDRRGEKPLIKRTSNLQEAIDFILRFEKNNPQQVIGVFTKANWAQDAYFRKLDGLTKNPVQIYNKSVRKAPSFDAPGIKLIHIQSSKGLEFDTVFIPEIQAMNFSAESMVSKMQFYVALSRAREQLFLLYNGNGQPEFLNLIPDELVNRD